MKQISGQDCHCAKQATMISQDVKYEWSNDDALVGSNFSVALLVQNTSREARTVTGVISLKSCFYTGVTKAQVKRVKFRRKLGPVKGDYGGLPAGWLVSAISKLKRSEKDKIVAISKE